MIRRRRRRPEDLEIGGLEPIIEGIARTQGFNRPTAPTRPGLATLVGIGGPALVEGLKYALGSKKRKLDTQPTTGPLKTQNRKIPGTLQSYKMAGTKYMKKKVTKRKTLRQIIRQEITRKLETKNAAIVGDATSTTGVIHYPSVGQGDARNQRSGDKIYATRIEIFLRVVLLTAADAGSHWCNVILSTPFSAALATTDLPTTSNLLDYDTDTQWVHYKKQFFFPQRLTGSTAVGDRYQMDREQIVNFSIPINKYIHYNGATGNDVIKGMPSLGIVTSDLDTRCTYGYRIWFKEL